MAFWWFFFLVVVKRTMQNEWVDCGFVTLINYGSNVGWCLGFVFGWWIFFSAWEKDHAKWIGGSFGGAQENDCTLLRWINSGTCKVLHNLCMKGSCLFVLFGLSHQDLPNHKISCHILDTIGKPSMNK